MKSKARKPVHHIMRLNRSLIVALPPATVRSLGWKAGQRVLVKRMPRGILIRDAITKKRK